ncbi:uncharacterized protein LOC108029982 isoform X2 [Drosophila biarmipes]|uniref:uncharacterized protein LOC108029982 isoform X2 n=1 Tax=Drosophila biarmipes TaxID=125945 RepID=UPI0021CC799D|nr:uncharacterized protein LOC108029982 isoform X2 [Drosophila biarmipes]
MFSINVPLLLCVYFFWTLYYKCEGKTNWEATPLSIGGTTTNPSAMDMDLRLERISRSEFGFSGTFFWNIDMDDNVEMRILNSYSGNEEDYKLTPYSIQPQKFIDYINTFYKDMLLPNLGNCTDMPRYDDGFVPPWPKATFNFTRCGLNGKGLPDILAEGFYRGEAIITALPTVAVNISATLRIKTKMF